MSGIGLVLLALIRLPNLEAFEFPKNFNQIDPLIFDFVKLDVLNFGHEFDSDIGLDMIGNLFQSSNFYISNDLSTNCDGRVLKVTFEQTAGDYENRTNRYLKDPCMSILIINGTYQDTFASQPYHFALLDDELFEVQKYSQSQKLIAVIKDEGIEYFEQDIFERRVNFKGAKIITADGTMRLHEYDTITRKVLYLMEKKFNFSAEMYRQEPLDFGTKLANGTWTGFVAAMMDGKMDFCASVMAFSTYRLEVVSPGFGFEMNDRYFVFRKPKSSGTDAFAIFYVFSGELWLAIGFSSIIIAMVISRGKLCAMMKSFGSVIKALLGQSEPWTSGRPSKKLLSFFLALYGAIVYWSYSGTLISSLTVSSYEVPIKSITDFMETKGFELHVPKGTATYDVIVGAIPNAEQKMKGKIDPFAIAPDDYLGKMIGLLNKTGPINEAFITYTSYIDSFIKEVYALGKEAYCEVDIQIVEDMPRTLSGYMFPYNSMLQPLFDRYMHNLFQDGIIRGIQERFAPQYSKHCTDDQAFHAVNFDYVQILFICLGTGGIMSIFILGIEKLLKLA